LGNDTLTTRDPSDICARSKPLLSSKWPRIDFKAAMLQVSLEAQKLELSGGFG